MVTSLIRLIAVGLMLVGEGVFGSVPWRLRVVVVILGEGVFDSVPWTLRVVVVILREVEPSQRWTRSNCFRHVLS